MSDEDVRFRGLSPTSRLFTDDRKLPSRRSVDAVCLRFAERLVRFAIDHTLTKVTSTYGSAYEYYINRHKSVQGLNGAPRIGGYSTNCGLSAHLAGFRP